MEKTLHFLPLSSLPYTPTLSLLRQSSFDASLFSPFQKPSAFHTSPLSRNSQPSNFHLLHLPFRRLVRLPLARRFDLLLPRRFDLLPRRRFISIRLRKKEMEELQKLEQVQRTLSFMQSRGFLSSSSNNNNDDYANRFLANLILLLEQPCGALDFDNKLSLISQHLPSISASFLEDASLWISREGYHDTCIGSDIPKESEYNSLQRNYEETAVVGLDAMQRANSTLEDFCRSYFMFHGMDANSAQAIFKYLPVLSFTESYIYQLDRLNEKILDMPTNGVHLSERGYEEFSSSQIAKLMDMFESDPFKPLLYILERHSLLTEKIREEFRCGAEYWTLERKLCCQLINKKEISIEDVMKTIQLKSFDYRVLNLLLYQLRQEKVNDLHMEFLSVSEFLVEVSDDLFDYEDDVLENNFNIFRMFIGIYGPLIAPTMLAKCITEAEEKYNSLLKCLDPQLSVTYQKRCEEATKEGGKVSGNPLGTWSIPPPIVDEESFRSKSNMLNSS